MQVGELSRVAIIKNNLSALYLEMKNDSLALSSSMEALEYFSPINDIQFLSQTYTNLGNVFSSLGDTVKALDSYMKALEYDTQNKDTFGISSAYTNIGTIYAESKNYSMARVFFEHALELDSMIQDHNSLMISYFNLGYNYLNESNYERALPFFLMSLYKAKQHSSYSYVLKNSKALSQLFEKKGDHALALNVLRSSLSIYDSLYGRERIAELNSIQKNFEIKRRNIENELLKAKQAKSLVELEKQKEGSYIFIGGLLIVIVILGFVWRSRNKIKQLNIALKRANQAQSQNSRQILLQKNELEKVNLENRELLSILIHDLKNPLAQIQLLSTLDNSDKKTEELKLIHQAAQNGMSLIERISTAHLIDEGKLNPKFKDVNIETLIQKSVELFAPLANKKGLKIALGTRSKCILPADEQFLKNILHNLISNAIKFSPNGASIFINYVMKEWGVEVRIRDEGPGFTEEDKKDLFTKYRRLSALPTGGESSSGVGLSIAKSLTERMGGSLSLNEAYTDGAEFVVKLPKVS